ncbi:hypothetical protein AVEN_14435-1 [Araneus ventricosus]|uniref:Uncharacterized protein n=1 Tax=Araneus ventricosus TaxID=182803 RepID=A0A4Y2V619_ARAVE|nr:hypothetical protein AVEN_207321-1 [Araneus ventricosus]GBO20037.1 hypothetical protein AVEN_14435-1 [Araneus ventricosus]
MYISQYPPPDGGNSFCLVVKIRNSGPKGPRFKSTHCHSGDSRTKNTQQLLSVPLLDGSTKNHIIHLLLHSPDDSSTTPTATQLSQFKVYDTFHSTL